MKRSTTARASILVLAAAAACATTQFDRLLAEQRWADAARVFAADTSLLNDESALYAAGMLYGTPGRPTFDAQRSETLLRRLLSQFPQSKHRNDASERLALLGEVARARRDAETQQRDLATQIEALTRETRLLRARLDSIVLDSDQLRRNATRAEADLRDRENQLRALRLELQRLKAIDLKRPPARVIKP